MEDIVTSMDWICPVCEYENASYSANFAAGKDDCLNCERTFKVSADVTLDK